MAQAELERLMHTVQRMLDYYRPAALDRKPVEVNELITRVLSLIGPQLADRSITLESRLAQNLPEIWAVADQIQQVLLNLLLNSMEALPAGGLITIETGPWREGVSVVIEDNGPGIEKSQRERIFEPFYSSKEGGTGLGLAISYGIIAAHGGSLDLVQGRGKGACFRIILPSGETE
jgi:signal transduction histidine kinase